MQRKDWLRYNVSCPSLLAVNGRFYRLLNIDATRRWDQQTPNDFCFAIKSHRFITHNKKLKGPTAPLRLQRERAVG